VQQIPADAALDRSPHIDWHSRLVLSAEFGLDQESGGGGSIAFRLDLGRTRAHRFPARIHAGHVGLRGWTLGSPGRPPQVHLHWCSIVRIRLIGLRRWCSLPQLEPLLLRVRLHQRIRPGFKLGGSHLQFNQLVSRQEGHGLRVRAVRIRGCRHTLIQNHQVSGRLFQCGTQIIRQFADSPRAIQTKRHP